MMQSTVLKLKIKNFDIAQSYFKGQAELVEKNYTLNLQGHSKDKKIKLPFPVSKDSPITIRFSGKNGTVVEDLVHFKGISEWIEIDSTDVLHYAADNQDAFENLEIFFDTD